GRPGRWPPRRRARGTRAPAVAGAAGGGAAGHGAARTADPTTPRRAAMSDGPEHDAEPRPGRGARIRTVLSRTASAVAVIALAGAAAAAGTISEAPEPVAVDPIRVDVQ